MTHPFKLATAAILLVLTAATSAPAQSISPAQARNAIAPLLQSSILATDDPQTRASDGAITYAPNPNPTTPNVSRPYSRSWFLAPVGFYVLPVLILALILTFKHLRNRAMHQTLRAMIEKGMPITPELIASLKPKNDERGQRMCYLLPGLICSAVGIGLMLNGGRAGLIPLLIGVAFLIAWQVEKRSSTSNQPPTQ